MTKTPKRPTYAECNAREAAKRRMFHAYHAYEPGQAHEFIDYMLGAALGEFPGVKGKTWAEFDAEHGAWLAASEKYWRKCKREDAAERKARKENK